ncbi:MBOAT family protein [Aquicoccus sp. SCR17]|nr:MBOAT family protein [Carideicomes alvinocaridis]
MLFTEPAFFVFLALVLLGFRWLPRRLRLPWLLGASLLFYGTFGTESLAALGAVAAIALAAGRWLLVAKRRRGLVFWAGTLAILGLMGLLKYWDPVAERVAVLPALGLAAPPGFSFYAFTAIALLADRYRAPAQAEAGAGEDLLYLAWFPKILAGPIERIASFRGGLRRRARLHPAVVAVAGQLILWGLVKKVVVADNLAPFVDRSYDIAAYAVPMELLIATYFFAFQIYCDFSGYTDIARGLSRLFGIRLSENFRRPYFATSIGEFWARRWHVTLSAWFRDYLYRPVLGPAPSGLRRYLALMLVFLVSGLWHAGLGYGFGWGFIVWGGLNGFYLWAERALRPARRQLAQRLAGTAWARVHAVAAGLLVFHLVLVSWIFFRAGSATEGWLVLRRIVAALPDLPTLLASYPFTAEHAFLAALILALLAVEAVPELPRLARSLRRAPRAVHWAGWLALLLALVLLGRWSRTAFVYMQF